MKKRTTTSTLSESQAKRPCSNEAGMDSLPKLLNVECFCQDLILPRDDLDLLPLEIFYKIAACTISNNKLDDTDFVALCLVDKRRYKMLHDSDLQPTCRLAVSDIRAVGTKAGHNYFKLHLFSKLQERLWGSTRLTINELMDVECGLPNLIHLSIDVYAPEYKKIVPLLPTRLESLHLSSWDELDMTYIVSRNLRPTSSIAGCSFDHLKRLKRLSLLASPDIYDYPIRCDDLKLPEGIHTLHMPDRTLYVDRHDFQLYATPFPGWSDIKTLSVASIEGFSLDFFLPALNTLTCHVYYARSSTRKNKLNVLTTSLRALSDDLTYTYNCNNIAVANVVVPLQQEYDHINEIATNGSHTTESFKHFTPHIGELLPINVCKPIKVAWLSCSCE